MKSSILALFCALCVGNALADTGKMSAEVLVYKDGQVSGSFSGLIDDKGMLKVNNMTKTPYAAPVVVDGIPALERSTYETGFSTQMLFVPIEHQGKISLNVHYRQAEVVGKQDYMVMGKNYPTPVVHENAGQQLVTLKPGVKTPISGSDCTSQSVDFVNSCKFALVVTVNPV